MIDEEAHEVPWYLEVFVELLPVQLKAFGDIIRYPAVEWMHRGTPMVWICAAGESGYLDVTPRALDTNGTGRC